MSSPEVAPPRDPDLPETSGPLGVTAGLESILRWLTAYPAYPLIVLLILLIAFGGLGAEVGAEHLFWFDNWWNQSGVGLGVGLLFGLILFVEFLSNRPTRLTNWLDARRAYSLWPSANPQVRSLGRVLFWGLSIALVLMYVVKVFVAFNAKVEPNLPKELTGWQGYLASRDYLWPFGVTYLCGLLVFRIVFLVDEWGWSKAERFVARRRGRPIPAAESGRPLRERLLDSGIRRRLERNHPTMSRDEQSLHGVGVLLGLITVLFLVGLILPLSLYLDRYRPTDAVWTPVPLAALILILFILLYGVLSFHLHRQRVIIGLAVLALAIWNWTLWPGNAYKLRFPNMQGYDAGHRTVLWPRDNNDAAWYKNLLKGTETYARTELIDSDEPIRAMLEEWRKKHKDQQPRLIFIATSGGGIRAAVWTAQVLNRFETDQQLKDAEFRSNIRMITGASGGMVATALYAADFENGPEVYARGDADDPYTSVLGEPSLNRTAQSLIFRDLGWNLLLPPGVGASWDRGQTLEWKWGHVAREKIDGRNPFGKSFRELRELERTGKRPSLVFSPMMIEDSRRLLVSNLNLKDVAISESEKKEYQFVSAVEFHRLFPDLSHDELKAKTGESWPYATSKGFTVATAARMSATFPVMSPAVSLPTTPPRRVVDAGYYDNYGLNLAALWIYKHRKVLIEHTSGVALIEIRAFPLHEAGQRFAATDSQTGLAVESSGSGELLTDAAAAISAPLDALFTARGNIAYYRNCELVDILRDTFKSHDPEFFYNGWFELTRPASLNWYITQQETTAIKRAFEPREKPKPGDPDQQLKSLKDWYGSGGKVPPPAKGP